MWLTISSSGSFSPRVRFLAHSDSAVVVMLPSLIAPQCAPASDRPISATGDSSISRTSSRLPAM